MQTSSEFRARHQVVASFKILRDAEAKRDFSAGWGEVASTGPSDVLDLNGDGQANFKCFAKSGESGGTVFFEEPSLIAPTLKEMQRVTGEAGKEVLTQEDFPQGLFMARQGAELTGETNRPLRSDLTTADFLVASHQPWDPALRYAVDTKAGEFLLYK